MALYTVHTYMAVMINEGTYPFAEPHWRGRMVRIVCYQNKIHNGPLTRYVKLGVAHAPGMTGTFSPPLTSKESAS